MWRSASVISVIGFMIFIWIEPHEQDQLIQQQQISEAATAAKSDQIDQLDQPAETKYNHADLLDYHKDNMAFVDFPDHVNINLGQEDASSSAMPSAKPGDLKPLVDNLADLKPVIASEAVAVEVAVTPLVLLTPLTPSEPSLTIEPTIKPEIKPEIKPVINPQTQPQTKSLTPIEITSVHMDEPKPSSAASPTAANDSAIITADFQSHRMAMQHLDQTNDRLELELFWPQSATEREKIAQILRQCFGMTAAYLTPDQSVYHIRNQAIERANRNLYSPYSRLSQTPADTAEADAIGTLRARLGQGTPLRLFTKIGDSYIIGGIMSAAGTPKLEGRIKATYSINKGKLLLSQININGSTISANVMLSDQSTGRCL